MKPDWDWCRARSEETLKRCYAEPNNWQTAAEVVSGTALNEIWDYLVKPLEYYFRLEDNIEMLIEESEGSRRLLVKYTPKITRWTKFKNYFMRLVKGK